MKTHILLISWQFIAAAYGLVDALYGGRSFAWTLFGAAAIGLLVTAATWPRDESEPEKTVREFQRTWLAFPGTKAHLEFVLRETLNQHVPLAISVEDIVFEISHDVPLGSLKVVVFEGQKFS